MVASQDEQEYPNLSPSIHNVESYYVSKIQSKDECQNNEIPKGSSLYKTELCKRYADSGTCRYGTKCQFAHGSNELRHVTRHPKYKTAKCKSFWGTGRCPYGARCRFIHNNDGAKQTGLDDKSFQLQIVEHPLSISIPKTEEVHIMEHHSISISIPKTENVHTMEHYSISIPKTERVHPMEPHSTCTSSPKRVHPLSISILSPKRVVEKGKVSDALSYPLTERIVVKGEWSKGKRPANLADRYGENAIPLSTDGEKKWEASQWRKHLLVEHTAKTIATHSTTFNETPLNIRIHYPLDPLEKTLTSSLLCEDIVDLEYRYPSWKKKLSFGLAEDSKLRNHYRGSLVPCNNKSRLSVFQQFTVDKPSSDILVSSCKSC